MPPCADCLACCCVGLAAEPGTDGSRAAQNNGSSLVQHLRDGQKRIIAERDALAEELALLQRSVRAVR